MGTGFIELLALLFIALKLTGKIQWPWRWVLSPIWIGLLIIALIIVADWILRGGPYSL